MIERRDRNERRDRTDRRDRSDGVHVIYVVVADQVHVSYVSMLTLTTWRKQAASTWRHVLKSLNWLPKIEFELIFIIVISNQFITGVRLRLTSSVKELGAILQKLINLDKIQNEKWDKRWFVGDADELLDEVVGSVQQRKRMLCSLKN